MLWAYRFYQFYYCCQSAKQSATNLVFDQKTETWWKTAITVNYQSQRDTHFKN